MPQTSASIRAQFALGPIPARLSEVADLGTHRPRTKFHKGQPLFPRVRTLTPLKVPNMSSRDSLNPKGKKRIEDVARDLKRYDVEAYYFLLEALELALKRIGKRRHLTGAELSQAIRELAIDRFGCSPRPSWKAGASNAPPTSATSSSPWSKPAS